MKRYLMRSPSNPFENPSYSEVLKNNLICGNSGNLIFPYSISRALLTEDAEIDYEISFSSIDDEEIERINANYDAFIIPLADAFRKSFLQELNNLTKLIRRLSIPSIVIGVGCKGGKIGDTKDSYVFDDAVKEFCNAVLEKSQVIGLRGEFTAKYLKRLGYTEEKDFTVIGCPSMYLYGESLPFPKELNLTKDSRINLNCKASLPKKIHVYQNNIRKQIPNHFYVVQNLYEFQTMFTGRSLLQTAAAKLKKTHKDYPIDYSHPLYRENRVRGFVSAKAWLDFIKKGDLNFGTRIHGNIVGVLSGLPTFIVAPDNRVLELAQYHNIPYTTIKELDCNTNIFHLLDGIDFSSVMVGHRERFQHYLDFLHSNGLSTIYDNSDHKELVCKFDRRIQEIDFRPSIVPFIHASYEEKMEAIHFWEWLLQKKQDKVRTLIEETQNLKKEMKQRPSGRISITIGRRTMDLFKKK